MKGKISLDNFIKKNNRLLITYGLFLTILSFSVSDLLRINEKRGAYLSIFVMIVLIILFVNILMNVKSQILSLSSIIFFILILLITGTISIGIIESFKSEWDVFINTLFGIFLIIIGGFLAFKTYNLLEKKKEKIYHIISFFGSIIILLIILLFKERVSRFLDNHDILSMLLYSFYFLFMISGFILSAKKLWVLCKKNPLKYLPLILSLIGLITLAVLYYFYGCDWCSFPR